MNLRSLGRIGRVSEIGLGTAQLANADGAFPIRKCVPMEDARRILAGAIDVGITFFDTADGYGCSEVLLGEIPAATRRSLVIATKAGRRDDGARDFSTPYLTSRVERSLKRLKTDCLDLFQLNKPSTEALKDGRVFALLSDLKRSGMIRAAGVVVDEPETGDACLASGVVDTLQVLHHLLYDGAVALMGRAAAAGRGVVVRSPLNSGLLSGPPRVFPKDDERSRYFSGPTYEARLRTLAAIQMDLSVPDERLFEFALGYVLSEPSVSVVIPGVSALSQLARAVGVGTQARLSADEVKRVRATVALRRARSEQN